MTPMRIILNGDGAFTELQGKTVHRATVDAVTCLEGGMSGGRTSVGFLIHLEDGSVVFAETSLALFQMANAAFAEKYGLEMGE